MHFPQLIFASLAQTFNFNIKTTLRKYALNKIVKEIRFVLSDLKKLQREVIESQILMRIPTVYHVIQIEKSSKLKISDF